MGLMGPLKTTGCRIVRRFCSYLDIRRIFLHAFRAYLERGAGLRFYPCASDFRTPPLSLSLSLSLARAFALPSLSGVLHPPNRPSTLRLPVACARTAIFVNRSGWESPPPTLRSVYPEVPTVRSRTEPRLTSIHLSSRSIPPI